jgi:GTP pyrophosphokinase
VVEIITGKQPAPSRNWLIAREGYLHSARSRAKVKAWFNKQEEAQASSREAAPAFTPGPAPELGSRPGAPSPTTPRQPGRRSRSRTPVEVEGVGDSPTTLARCCQPVPPQPITGYVTLSRGVTIHRSDCAGLARMRAGKPERILSVGWTSIDGVLADVAISAGVSPGT